MSSVPYTYLLPIRRATFDQQEAEELATYFTEIGQTGCELLVVDGSPEAIFARQAEAWRGTCRHLPVDRSFGYRNDKVNGIHTGVQAARSGKIILADDDIRYTPAEIQAVEALLDDFEVVRPQNFLFPLPWWGKTEAARMLINRATLRAADYPGTCAFRREVMLESGSYDGDVLFDNEEIIRHFAVMGRQIAYASDLFVQKRPPRFRKWIEQRPRQAYEDFGMRAKTGLFLALPVGLMVAGVASGLRGAAIYVGVIAIFSVLLALRGWRRGCAAKFFPLVVCFFAPLWVGERTVSTYIAGYWYLKYGGYPFGDRILSKGIGRAWVAGGRAASQQLRQRKNVSA